MRRRVSACTKRPTNTTATIAASVSKRVVTTSAPVGPWSVRTPIMRMNRPSATSAASAASFSAAATSANVMAAFSRGNARPLAHTFSTSGRPKMPVGRKMSTMMRIENAATSLYSIEK